ncbi:MAG: tRNA pseudouridine(55) synthase TruB [Candidatus Omnitrophica bacterium]|nr:tRNA pseudouridine(55) synthase TruB [Candidatus Omnitrophota bacterium]
MTDYNPSGIIILDKPKGITSHDAVNLVRCLYKTKRVGHAGTLDPLATGVLVILLGKSTKLSQHIVNSNKEYDITMKLGVSTDTGDALGKVITESPLKGMDEVLIKNTIMAFEGETKQIPPMYSAVKHKGVSLYKLARKGIAVERQPRLIYIEHIEVKKIEMPYVSFKAICSKGTYIRQLCVDIGARLGCGAHVTELRRVSSGDFHLDDAISFDELKSMSRDSLDNILLRHEHAALGVHD